MIPIIVETFPSISETFILREILHLEKNGLKPIIIAFRKGSGKQHDECSDIKDIIYLPNRLSPKGIFAAFLYCLTNPVSVFRLLKFILGNHRLSNLRFHRIFTLFYYALYLGGTLKKNIKHIHSHFANEPSTLALFVNILTGIKFSVSIHGRDLLVEASFIKEKADSASFMCVCSKYSISLLQEKAGLINDSKILSVPHGIDLSAFSFHSSPLSNPVRLLAVGRLVGKKGFRYLIEAMKELKDSCLLTIVGDGPEIEILKSLANGIGNHFIQFTGSLTQKELAELYKTHHILIVPSCVDKDGDSDIIPNVIVEAMAYGVSVIASRLPAIEEVVIHNETGLTIPQKDPHAIAEAVKQLIENPKMRDILIRNARQFVEKNYDINVTARYLLFS